MTTYRRLKPTERKFQICQAAKTVFLSKGFAATTMEDIIAETGLSKGGVYHYYKNTTEIFHDIIDQANAFRFAAVMAFVNDNPDATIRDIMIETILDKLLDSNEFKPLYAMLLIEKVRNPKLEALYQNIYSYSSDRFRQFCESNELKELLVFDNEVITVLMNAIVVSTELLGARPVLEAQRRAIKQLINDYVSNRQRGDFYEQR